MAYGRGSLATALTPAVRKWFVETGAERPLEYPSVFNTPEMEWNPITDRQISGLGTAPSMAEGARFTMDSPITGGSKAYEAVPYGYGFEVTYPMWRDDLYGLMRIMSKELARGCRNRKEVDAFAMLNNAFSSASAGFDGLALCNTAHTRLDGLGTQGNRPSPDIGLSVTGVQAALFAFETIVNERGLPGLMQPSTVVINPFNRFTAREIFGSPNRPYTANNEINAIVEDDMAVYVAHYLTSTTAWFVMASKGTHELNFFLRDDTIFDSFDDPQTKNAVFTAWQRHTAGFSSWKGVWGSTG